VAVGFTDRAEGRARHRRPATVHSDQQAAREPARAAALIDDDIIAAIVGTASSHPTANTTATAASEIRQPDNTLTTTLRLSSVAFRSSFRLVVRHPRPPS